MFYQNHIKQLEAFHLHHLISICNIKLRGYSPNTKVLAKCCIPSIKSVVIRAQLRWVGHVVRTEDFHVPKVILYNQLNTGPTSQDIPYLNIKAT